MEFETYLRRMMKRFNKEVQENMHKVKAGRATKSRAREDRQACVKLDAVLMAGLTGSAQVGLLSPGCGDERQEGGGKFCVEMREWTVLLSLQ